MPDELIVLGSASGVPTQRRFTSAYALKVTSKLFLLDCGAPVSSLLYEQELDPVDVRAVFLSHWHMDHVANLGLLLTQNHLRKRPRALNIYGPKGTRGKIERLLNDSFMSSESLNYKLKVKNIKPGKKYKEALLRVRFFKTQHLENPKYKTNFGRRAISCGMVIDGPGWRIVYSGDLTSPKELSPYIDGCDLLIHEMTHVRAEEVAEFASAAKVPHVLISHIDFKLDESPEKIRDAFNKRYKGDLMIAEDGMRLRLSKVRKSDSIEVKLFTTNSASVIPNAAVNHLNDKQQEFSRSHSFLQVLQQDFNLSRYFSQQLLKAAQEILVQHTRSLVHSGQVRLIVDKLGSSPETSEDEQEQEKVEVVLTIDAGAEDLAVKQRERAANLRRGRILRLLEEAINQGGILSRSDLANVLGVDLQIINRDLRVLAAEEHPIYTSEHFDEDEPGPSYKAKAVELWLDETDEDEIARWLHHAPASVRRYINTFLQVAVAYEQATPLEHIAGSNEIPVRLVQDYVQVYERAKSVPARQTRLKQATVQNASSGDQ